MRLNMRYRLFASIVIGFPFVLLLEINRSASILGRITIILNMHSSIGHETAQPDAVGHYCKFLERVECE